MRTHLIAWVRRLLRWLEDSDPKLERAHALVTWADQLTSTTGPINGERKRHQVLNRLVVEYPQARVRDLAFLIERVLQETPYGRVQ